MERQSVCHNPGVSTYLTCNSTDFPGLLALVRIRAQALVQERRLAPACLADVATLDQWQALLHPAVAGAAVEETVAGAVQALSCAPRLPAELWIGRDQLRLPDGVTVKDTVLPRSWLGIEYRRLRGSTEEPAPVGIDVRERVGRLSLLHVPVLILATVAVAAEAYAAVISGA